MKRNKGMDKKNSYFGPMRCKVCGVVLSACLCVATLAHGGEHPESRFAKWPVPDRISVVTSTATATGTASLAFPVEWLNYMRRPPR